ncbi:Predicted lipoprotein with conserved Yx(FWY)xxD motif [Halobiforma haloterrestris]|uniref:Predicted lipoprotein with conserved Yx(FWY)xxD motif n=1 Tax=Natronobacterium haloterrestre TaxID=148448 RepID=A0A1I1LI73_NATHA|nr:plastocyanin/azurin family copper-binding protein [Halobiforma haloterrestris]SFC72814.1 Predicted lipoprotein with conserved Yx(FWY)xxD motif [Halobiforma haloterrestris]
MTRTNAEKTDESTEEPTVDRLGFERRPLLKAVGAGTALAAGAGITTAGGGESDEDDDDDGYDGTDAGDGTDTESETGEIHPVYGYPARDAAAIPDSIAPDHEVTLDVAPPGPDQPPFLYFDPAGLRVDSGDVVQFTFASPDHTVTAMHPEIGLPQRVPDGAEPFSSPVQGPGSAWLYRFDHEGVYDIYCAPHLDFGMVMRVVVGTLEEAELPEYARSVEDLPSREDVSAGLNEMSEQNEDCEWPNLMPAGILGTNALDAMTIQSAGTVPFSAVVEELGYELIEEPQGPPQEGMGGPTVGVRDHPDYGEILVGPEGMTVYMFDQDTQNAGESACSGDCADAWPPLTVDDGEPVAGDGVTADLEAFERDTGERQVTANGWPLYYFARDEEPGDVQGQGVNDVWWVLRPDGTPLRTDSDD